MTKINPENIDHVKATKAIENFLDALGIDWKNDVNMVGTPARVSKMYIQELYSGLTEAPPRLTDFDTNREYNSLRVSGPWPVYSSCSHHMMPVYGSCVIGIISKPQSKLPGLSKYGRIVDWFSRRPQLQESLCADIADYMLENFDPLALGVYISASHMCCTHRGIKAKDSLFVTTELRGEMMEGSLKQEFIAECHRLVT